MNPPAVADVDLHLQVLNGAFSLLRDLGDTLLQLLKVRVGLTQVGGCSLSGCTFTFQPLKIGSQCLDRLVKLVPELGIAANAEVVDSIEVLGLGRSQVRGCLERIDAK